MCLVQGLDTPAYSVPGIQEWLLILPIFNRLYTSVIPWDPENKPLEVSWSTDMSPTTILRPRSRLLRVAARVPGVVGCTRGGGMRVGREEGYTGYYPPPSQDPYFIIF